MIDDAFRHHRKGVEGASAIHAQTDRTPQRQRVLNAVMDHPLRTSEAYWQLTGGKMTKAVVRARLRDMADDAIVIRRASRVSDHELIWDVVRQCEVVRVTDAIKRAYYASAWWKCRREERLVNDGHFCIQCCAFAQVVHHWHYDLFAERIDDLASLCNDCHERIHSRPGITLHFPRVVSWETFERITKGTN